MNGEKKQRVYDLEDRLIDFCVRVMDVVEALPNSRTGNHVASQFLRCGTSPAPNHGEAQSAESPDDFIHKMKISLKELRESRIWMRMIQRKALIKPPARLEQILVECNEPISIFVASIKTAQRNRAK